MEETILNFKKPFWAIVHSGDPKGYHTGTAHTQTALYECDTATELEDFLASGSVESGESMGDYIFKIIAQSHTNLNQISEFEKQEAEEQEAEEESRRLEAEEFYKTQKEA